MTTARADVGELVAAARFFVDVASRYDQRSIGYRIALRRLELASEDIDDDVGQVEPGLAELRAVRCPCERALWLFLAVIIVVLALALYGLVRTFGWFT